MDSSVPAVVGFAELDHFAGFDWATQKHHVAVVDRCGNIVRRLEFADGAEGWLQLREMLAGLGKVGVAIETSRGPEVERLLAMGLTVYPMNPKAAQRFRERKAPAGGKDDPLDAWSFADALRSDGHGWRPLLVEDQATQLLRIICRDEIALIEQRTALVLQLRAALREYYPAALEAFEDWTMVPAWQFVLQFATPAELVAAGKRKWQNFLHKHRLWTATAERRMEIFARADQFASGNAAVIAAKSMLAVSIVKMLLTLEAQIKEYRRRIEKLFDEHPDGDLFKSLPGGGAKLAPRLLGEMGANRQVFASAGALQGYAGTAPVTEKSGKKRFARIRRMCNNFLRTTVHLWADESRRECAWADAYYQEKKTQGKSHAQALRCLGQRWLKILWKMWQERRVYDEALHMKSLAKSGSWVLGLVGAAEPALGS
jgi:transposase